MTDDEIAAGVQRAIASALRMDSARVSVDDRLVEDLGADGLDRVAIFLELEAEFGIKLAQTVRDVQSLVALALALSQLSALSGPEA